MSFQKGGLTLDGKIKLNFKLSKKAKAFLYTLLIAVVILLIAITAAQKLGNVTVGTMFSNLRAYVMSMGSGDGYPYSIEAGSIADISVYNSNLVVLTDDRTELLTSTAKEIAQKPHSFANPVMKTNGGLAIVYDLDSGKFRLQNSSDIIVEKELPARIMSAAVGKKGNYAVGTYGTDVQSVLTVYSSSGREDFIWKFKSERISDIALSDNGKSAAVSTIYSNNGKISSKLYVFSFKSDKYDACFDYPSSVLVNVSYVGKSNIIATGDNIRSFIRNGKTKTDKDFGSDSIRGCSAAENGKSAVVFSKYGSTSLSNLTVYKKNNKEKFSVDFDGEVKWVDFDGEHTAVLFENEIKTFSKSGKEIGNITFSGDPDRVIIDGKSVYLVTSSNIQCYKLRGTQTEEAAKKAEG